MKDRFIVFITLLGLVSCNTDNFYDVTKTIKAPEVIEFDIPFKVELFLINNTNSSLPLTFDKNITKSIQLMPQWYCGEEYLLDRTPNPRNKNHDYYSVELKSGNNLKFELGAELKSYSNGDSLVLIIDNYEKDFKLAKPDCDEFYVVLSGMWIPGKVAFVDAMEGYGFSTTIKIKNNR
jgi:hypothetical protein